MNVSKVLLIGGILLLIIGVVATVQLAWLIVNARIHGIFDSIATHLPAERLPRMRCPLLLVANERGKVRATVANPSQEILLYKVSIQSNGLRPPASDARIEVSLEPGARWRYAWPVQASQSGIAVVVVQALSDRDRRMPGYHIWPTSFRQACGIPVVKSAFVRARMVGLSLGGLGLGVGLCLPWLRDKLRRRRSGRGE